MRNRYGRLTIGLLLLNACSGNYMVGHEDGGDGGSPDMEQPGAENPTMGESGTGATMPSFGGGPSMNPPDMNPSGGATLNPPDMNPGGGATMYPPNPPGLCDPPAGPPGSPRPTATPEEVWKRLTRFILGQEIEPDTALPAVTTPAWIEGTASRLYYQYPPGPMFQVLLESTGLNETTAATYGEILHAPMATSAALLTSSEPNRTGGVLTDPEFLAQYPSISARGAFIASAFQCTPVPVPPAEHSDYDVTGSPGISRRQAHEALISQPVCQGCHRFVDAPGYSLENFDGEGEYRVLDNGVPVDASGSFSSSNGQGYMFSDYRDLAAQLEESCEFKRCFASQLLTTAIATSRELDQGSASMLTTDYDVARVAADYYYAGDSSVFELVRIIVTSSVFISE